LVLRRFDPGLRLLLESTNYPQICPELHGKYHAERIALNAIASSNTPEPKPASGLAIGGISP
jgi:hypothetical protein